jgi:hypothetical protein
MDYFTKWLQEYAIPKSKGINSGRHLGDQLLVPLWSPERVAQKLGLEL